MAKARDCIKAIQASAAEGTISEAQAASIIAELQRRADLRAREKFIKFEDALKEIAGEMQQVERNNKALVNRQKLLTIKTFRESKAFVQRSPKWANGLVKLMEQIDMQWKGLHGRYLNAFEGRLGDAVQDFRAGRHGRDFTIELWELSLGDGGTPGRSGNKVAQAMAKAFYDTNRELVAFNNRHGAYVTEAPGWVLPQTHDFRRVRQAGGRGTPEQKKTNAFKVWRAHIESLNIDWERTLDGDDQDRFFRNFFNNVYERVYGPPSDVVNVQAMSRGGTLADKVSSQRVLWFKDADSAYKYNEAFGSSAWHEAAMDTIRNKTRSGALMMNLGPNPGENLDHLIRSLQEEGREVAGQVDALKSSVPKNMYEVLSGIAEVSERPTLSRIIDNIKAFTFLTKAGGIVLSSFSDKGFMQSAMAYRGFTALERFAAQIQGLRVNTPAERQILQEVDMLTSSAIATISNRYMHDTAPSRSVRKGVQWLMDWQGMNWWTRTNRDTMGLALTKRLGLEADMPYQALDGPAKRALDDAGISAAEWDVWRRHTEDVEGERVLTPEATRFDDDTMNTLLRGEGLSETGANRRRKRDSMDAKMRAYFSDFIAEAVPETSLRVKAMLTQGISRGKWSREALNLIGIFKGFPLTVALKTAGRAKEFGFKEWWNLADKGKWNLISLIAQTAALGYLSMTVKDLLKGRTRKKLLDEDGNPNVEVFVAAMQRGGGLGIYSDFLFSEYDQRYRTVLGGLAGPVFGQLDPVGTAFTEARQMLTGAEDVDAEKLGYRVERIAEQNIPFANLFYVKPVLDYLIFWQLREALSPGVLRRTEKNVRDQGYQDFWIEPSETID